MATQKTKANVGLTLVLLFVIVLVTGIILHLKSHGTIIQPRGVIKIVHWVSGILMVIFATWHGVQFKKMFNAIKSKYAWFWGDTWVVIVFVTMTLITGMIKLLSPVKIPHLGLWHYWCGMLMSAAIVVHLFRGIPGWNRLRKIN